MNTARDIELVVFDLAGTTVHDDGQVAEAFSSALAEEGMKLDQEKLRSLRGASKYEAMLALMQQGPDLQERARQKYLRFCERLSELFQSRGIRPIQGVHDVFVWLRHRGIRVAINTGFNREIMDLLLSRLGWADDLVDATVCVDDVPEGRPAPFMIFRAMMETRVVSVNRVANIGDTVFDLQAGYNGGVRWNIGVLTGAHPHELLTAERPTRLLASVADLPSLWDSEE